MEPFFAQLLNFQIGQDYHSQLALTDFTQGRLVAKPQLERCYV